MRPFTIVRIIEMSEIDSVKIQQQFQLWETAIAAQRRYAEAQGCAPAKDLEKLRQEAEFLTAAASSFHLESMTSKKTSRH